MNDRFTAYVRKPALRNAKIVSIVIGSIGIVSGIAAFLVMDLGNDDIYKGNNSLIYMQSCVLLVVPTLISLIFVKLA